MGCRGGWQEAALWGGHSTSQGGCSAVLAIDTFPECEQSITKRKEWGEKMSLIHRALCWTHVTLEWIFWKSWITSCKISAAKQKISPAEKEKKIKTILQCNIWFCQKGREKMLQFTICQSFEIFKQASKWQVWVTVCVLGFGFAAAIEIA